MKALPENFWAKVEKWEPCWIWQAATTAAGYGALRWGSEHMYAHRLAYQLSVGPIPNGRELDHLCRNHACVNPDHLEAVTHRENNLRGVGPIPENARKTHCKRGHRFDEANTNWFRGKRRCRKCHAANERKRYQQMRAAA